MYEQNLKGLFPDLVSKLLHFSYPSFSIGACLMTIEFNVQPQQRLFDAAEDNDVSNPNAPDDPVFPDPYPLHPVLDEVVYSMPEIAVPGATAKNAMRLNEMSPLLPLTTDTTGITIEDTV